MTAEKPKVIVIMPAYNAAATLQRTVELIPRDVVDEIIVVDDHSSDTTIEVARKLDVSLIWHPHNVGYGGNQRTSYLEALQRGADVVVMLHPDGQYEPSLIPRMIEPIIAGEADCVLGSRFAESGAVRSSGMPRYKIIANRGLTTIENWILKRHFTELHTGYRAYSRNLLMTVPFMRNNNGFVFDTELVMQAVHFGFRVAEVPARTTYSGDVSSIGFGPSVVYGSKRSAWVPACCCTATASCRADASNRDAPRRPGRDRREPTAVNAVHLLLLVAGVSGLGAAGLRCSSQLAAGLAPRVLGGVSVAVGLAVAEALALGLAGQGASPWWLTAAAVATFVISRLLLRAPTPTVRDQIAQRWTQSSVTAQALVGGLTVFVSGVTAFQLWHPTIGADGLRYHAAQPVVWLSDGHPGSFHQTLANFPTQAYPRTIEVLVEWLYAIARTPVAAVPIAVGFAVLAAGSAYVGLRRLNVTPVMAALATAAGLLLPLNMRQTSGVYSDLPALAWLACATALCVISVEEPAVIGLAAIAEGLAIGTKPSTAPLALIGLAWAVWINRRWAVSHLRRLAAPAILAAGLGGVWYVANWVVYGAPLWPFSRFPSGPPVPPVWRLYTSRFLTEPVTVIRAVGGHPFVVLLAGGLLLLAAVPVLALLALLPVNRPTRRTLLVGAVLVALDVVLWAGSQFTALADAYPVVLTTLRYLSPAPLAAAGLVALASRGGAVRRVICAAWLLVALGLDVWEMRGSRLGFPYRPGLAICLALIAIGAVAAVLAAHTRLVPHGIRLPGVATGLVLLLGLVMIVPASRFLDHYRATAQRQAFADAPILAFLAEQPGWTHGNAPVAAGYTAYATLAGPHFAHPLSYIPNHEPCASIRAAARRGWVVLEPLGGERHRSLDYLRAPACMAGVKPVATIGKVKVYAPARLLAHQ